MAEQQNAREHGDDIPSHHQREGSRPGSAGQFFELFSSRKIPLMRRHLLGAQVVDAKHATDLPR